MAAIFCFTSTGNSLYTAGKIAEQAGGRVFPMNDASLDSQAEIGDDVIGFVFPVFFWGLPRAVERFIAGMKIANKDAYIFSVATYGGIAHGMHGRIDGLLKQKGARLSYGVNLKSVENYIPRYKVKDSDAFRQKIDGNISGIISAVTARETGRIQAYTFINKIIYRSYPDEGSDKLFTIAPACTGCAVCCKVCPVGNIEMKEGKPEFLHKCEHCLACLQHCPLQAIDWDRKTEGKKHYRHPAVTVNDLIAFYGGE